MRVSTKDRWEREEEQVEKLLKPVPGKRPPRYDLRNRTHEDSDPDLETKDQDMSLNYKGRSAAIDTSRFQEFLDLKHNGGKKRVPNPNPGGRDSYVAFESAMKNEAFRKKIHKEYKAWLDKAAPAKAAPAAPAKAAPAKAAPAKAAPAAPAKAAPAAPAKAAPAAPAKAAPAAPAKAAPAAPAKAAPAAPAKAAPAAPAKAAPAAPAKAAPAAPAKAAPAAPAKAAPAAPAKAAPAAPAAPAVWKAPAISPPPSPQEIAKATKVADKIASTLYTTPGMSGADEKARKDAMIAHLVQLQRNSFDNQGALLPQALSDAESRVKTPPSSSDGALEVAHRTFVKSVLLDPQAIGGPLSDQEESDSEIFERRKKVLAFTKTLPRVLAGTFTKNLMELQKTTPLESPKGKQLRAIAEGFAVAEYAKGRDPRSEKGWLFPPQFSGTKALMAFALQEGHDDIALTAFSQKSDPRGRDAFRDLLKAASKYPDTLYAIAGGRDGAMGDLIEKLEDDTPNDEGEYLTPERRKMLYDTIVELLVDENTIMSGLLDDALRRDPELKDMLAGTQSSPKGKTKKPRGKKPSGITSPSQGQAGPSQGQAGPSQGQAGPSQGPVTTPPEQESDLSFKVSKSVKDKVKDHVFSELPSPHDFLLECRKEAMTPDEAEACILSYREMVAQGYLDFVQDSVEGSKSIATAKVRHWVETGDSSILDKKVIRR